MIYESYYLFAKDEKLTNRLNTFIPVQSKCFVFINAYFSSLKMKEMPFKIINV